VLQAPFLKYI